MGRKAKIITKSPYRLRDWRNHRGITLEKVGEALGMTGQNYGKIERGQVDLLPNYIEPLAQLFDVDATDLMLSPKATAKAARGVPILGRVSAGVGYFSDDFAMGAADDWLEDEPAEGRIALRVDGDSMAPLAHPGDIVVFGPRHEDPSPLINRRVMAHTADGQNLFKVLRKGRAPGTFDLYSLNSAYDPIEGAELLWVLPLERLHVR